MRIIRLIEDRQVIRDILAHLGLQGRPPACARTAESPKIHHAITLFNHPVSDARTHALHPHADVYADTHYSWDDFFQS